MRLIAALLALAALAGAVAYGALVWWPARPGYSGERPAFRPVALNPNGHYTVTLWDVDYTVPGAPYRGRVEAWAAAYHRAHPNITVEVRLLPPDGAQAELQAALARGRAPDVFAAPYDWPPLDTAWRVPLDRYLRTGKGDGRAGTVDPSAFTDAGLASLRDTRGLAALPRWLAFWWWVADGRRLKEDGGAPGPDDLLVAVAKNAELWWRMNHDALVMDAGGERAALEMFAAAGPSEEAWARAAAALDGLARAQALPAVDAGAEETALIRFAKRQAVVIGGLTPPALDRVMRRLSWAIPVPPPGGAAPEPLIGASGVYVFYQRPYQGVAHTQAAVQVARDYSLWRDAEVEAALGVVPAGREGAAAWQAGAPKAWAAAVGWALAEAGAGRAVDFPPRWDERARSAWEAVRPTVARLVRGEDVRLSDAVRAAWGRP
ncbi:MAG: extracellular solute-binding protein [Firmicutes bacterium]|nr:extracellular solute-binding protein [Bacillota bacterium]